MATRRGTAPDGYVEPSMVFLVEFTDATGDASDGQAGAFTTRAEAQAALDLLEAEGRHGPLRINAVEVHARAIDWEHDR